MFPILDTNLLEELNYVIELLQKNSNAIAGAARDVKLRQIVAVENQVGFLSFHIT